MADHFIAAPSMADQLRPDVEDAQGVRLYASSPGIATLQIRGMNHYRRPIIASASMSRKALMALRGAVDEMLSRYEETKS